jgi:methylmalonyl-CoA mutase
VIRATEEEKEYQIHMLSELHRTHGDAARAQITKVQEAAINNRNMFEQLMEACKYASLGEITHALFEVGGQYRRNM